MTAATLDSVPGWTGGPRIASAIVTTGVFLVVLDRHQTRSVLGEIAILRDDHGDRIADIGDRAAREQRHRHCRRRRQRRSSAA